MEEKKNWGKSLSRSTVILVILFSIMLIIFAALDLPVWATVLCEALSAIGTLVLGIASIIQNNRAENTNERLAKINQEQLESSVVKNNYPLIKFCDLQRIENNSELVLRFFDTRNIPLKRIHTRNVVAIPLAGRYENEEKKRIIVLRKSELDEPLQFTFNHDDSQTGFYMVRVPSKNLFVGFRYCRVELEMELISTTGVVTVCKGYVLLDGENERKGKKEREYPSAYHQFFEIKKIISEKKYNKDQRQ